MEDVRGCPGLATHDPSPRVPTSYGFAGDAATLARLFGPRDDLFATWVDEPQLPTAPEGARQW